jgi:hypothetical protein
MEKKQKDLDQERFLIEMYSSGRGTLEEQFLDGMRNFIVHTLESGPTLESILQEASKCIQTLFQFKKVAFGIRCRDGSYRYLAIVGFESEAARRKIIYTSEDIKDIIFYRSVRICKNAQFHLSEETPHNQERENIYNRPNPLGTVRQHPDDMIEGDFIVIILQGKNREIIGWIEVSGTTSGKLPGRETILRLEFFGSCLTPIIIGYPEGVLLHDDPKKPL